MHVHSFSMSADLSDVERFHDQVIDARPVVPNQWGITPKWVSEEWLWVGRRTAASIVCWNLKFLELRTSTFCYMSKTKTQSDLCEVHIISIIIPISFLLYSFHRPDCRIECCAGGLTCAGCRYQHLRGECRKLHCYECGAGTVGTWCGVGTGWEILCAANWMLSQSIWT